MAYASNAIASSSSSTEDPFQPPTFVRALYDYQSTDPSSLSFYRDDIIEVLTRIDTGWWDGILGGVRGWFPSNYVSEISEVEVREMMRGGGVFGGSALDYAEEGVDLGAVMAQERVGEANQNPADFWVPEITPDGQVRARNLIP
jgi:son of sevenless-like protein